METECFHEPRKDPTSLTPELLQQVALLYSSNTLLLPRCGCDHLAASSNMFDPRPFDRSGSET